MEKLYTIKYGISSSNIDVTDIAYTKLIKNNIIFIPSGDYDRAIYFTDPLMGILKIIIITDSQNITTEYDTSKNIFIDTENNKIYTDDVPQDILLLFPFSKLAYIHTQLKINFGSFEEEYPEQFMAVSYITGKEKILEIGANIGRNSLIIAYILNQNDNNNFVSLECDLNIFNQLKINKTINNLDFFIENSALSKRNLIQKGWDTVVSDVVLDGYTKVDTITYEQLCSKYNIIFDTLVLDCEGAFYYILVDMPEILNNINLIIMENDYNDISHKIYIDDELIKNNFYVDYSKSGGWGPCNHNFFEVWKRKL
jgi:FkbM family methyltransferase